MHAVSRGVIRAVLRSLRRRGRNLRHVIIVGAGAHGRDVAARLRAAPWSGLSVRAFYDDDRGSSARSSTAFPCAVRSTASAAIRDAGVRPGVDRAAAARGGRASAQCSTTLRTTSAVIRFVPDIFGFHLLNHSITEVAGLPVLTLTDTPMAGVRFACQGPARTCCSERCCCIVALPLMRR